MTLSIKICRFLILLLAFSTALLIWNGNTTGIEIKDFVVQVIILGMLAITAVRLLYEDELRIPMSPQILFILVYGAILISVYLFTYRSILNTKAFLPQLYGLITFILVIHYFEKNDIRKLIYCCISPAAIASVYGILQYLHLDPLNWMAPAERQFVVSFFGHKNYFAMFLLLMIPLTVFSAYEAGKTVLGVVVGLLAGLMIVALVVSYSRGALISFIISSFMAAMFWFSIKKRSEWKWKRITIFISSALAVIIISLTLLALVMPKKIQNDFIDLVERRLYMDRIQYYKAATETISKYPVFGIGPGNFVTSYPLNVKHKVPPRSPDAVLKHVHNSPLEIWLEYGLFALVVYLGILAAFFRKWFAKIMIPDHPNDRLMLLFVFLALISYLTYSLFTVAAQYMSSIFYFWFVLGIGYIGIQSDRNTNGSIRFTNRIKDHQKLIVPVIVAIGVIFSISIKTVINNYRSDIFLKKGHANVLRGRIDNSLKYYDKAIRLRPESVGPYYQRGYVYFQKRNYNRALEDFQAVQTLAPNYANIYYKMAACYYKKKEWLDAIRMAEISHTHYPDYTPPISILAMGYYSIGKLSKSLYYCKILTARNPKDTNAQNLKKHLEQKLKKS